MYLVNSLLSDFCFSLLNYMQYRGYVKAQTAYDMKQNCAYAYRQVNDDFSLNMTRGHIAI